MYIILSFNWFLLKQNFLKLIRELNLSLTLQWCSSLIFPHYANYTKLIKCLIQDKWNLLLKQLILLEIKVCNACIFKQGIEGWFNLNNVHSMKWKWSMVIYVQVFDDQSGAEPGWKGGEMNGKCGWFPEAYVEKMEDSSQAESSANDLSTGITSSEDSSFMAVQGRMPAVSPTPGQVRKQFSHLVVRISWMFCNKASWKYM